MYPIGRSLRVPTGQTLNYELGVKGDLADHKLTFDASLYHIDWKDLQLSLVKDGLGYFANGNNAKSEGLELSMAVKPWRIYDYIVGCLNRAVLTQALPPQQVYGQPGDRLPSVAASLATFL